MSLPKAQLVDPQGNMNLPGMTATGVVTATSLKGDIAGSATALTGNPDLDVGIVTASSFVGQGDGHAANITGTPQLNLGITTATSFVGDATGKAAGLTGTPNLNVGLITATSFVGFVTGDIIGNVGGNVEGNITGDITGDVTGNVTGNIAGDVEGDVVGNISGNVTGLASSIKSGASLGVGVCTAISYYGDGSGLSGAGSSAYIAQEITANSAETIIDLTYGNVIYYKGETDTTIGFASTSAAEQITFIRDTNPDYNVSFSTGAVTFNGSSQSLHMAASTSSMDFGSSGKFTIEFFVYLDTLNNGISYQTMVGRWNGTDGYCWLIDTAQNAGDVRLFLGLGGDNYYASIETADDVITAGQWYHIAVVKNGTTGTIFVDGVSKVSNSNWTGGNTNNSTIVQVANNNSSHGSALDGQISNFRVTNGQALYTSNFVPPSQELTTTSQGAIASNVKILMCQSTSDPTAGAVTTGTITNNGSATASSQTISLLSGSLNAGITWPDRVKWKNDTTPTLINNVRTTAMQLFRFTTVDTGLTYNGWEEMKNDQDSFDLLMWGDNSRGQLAQNDTNGRSSPIQVPSTDGFWSKLANQGNGQQAAAGKGMKAIKTDGTLWSWGYNYRGVGGWNNSNSADSRSSPVQIPGSWSSVADSYFGALGVKTDGTLWAWGSGTSGGNGTNNQTSYSSPTQVGTDTTWSTDNFAVARSEGTSAADSCSAAIKADGTLWTWGDNTNGALGHSNQTDYSSPKQVPGSEYKRVFADRLGFRALYGTPGSWGLKTWGLNDSGQLASNNTNNKDQPFTVPGSYAEFDSGSSTSIAVKTDGTLWMWGYGGFGNMGQNQGGSFGVGSFSSPKQVGSNTNWSKCGAGYNTGLATKTDGTLWAWGLYNSGFLGQNNMPGDGDGRSSPTQIGTATYWTGQISATGSRGAGIGGRNYPS